MSLLSDIGDVITSPVGTAVMSAAVPFWGGSMIDYLGGSNSVLGRAAEVSMTTSPALVQGDSFSQAFAATYGVRLKAVASYFLGQTGSEAQANDTANRLINLSYQKLAGDSRLSQGVTAAAAGATDGDVAGALDRAGFSPEAIGQRYAVRPDVAAMAINAILHRDVYNVSDYATSTGVRFTVHPIGRGASAVERARAALAAASSALARGAGSAAAVAQAQQAYISALVAANPPQTSQELYARWQAAAAKYGPDSPVTKGFLSQYQNALHASQAGSTARGAPLHTGFPVTFASAAPHPLSVVFADANAQNPPNKMMRDVALSLLFLTPAVVVYMFLKLPKKRSW